LFLSQELIPFDFSIEDEKLRLQRLYEASGKLSFLHAMLPKLKEKGHRILIFSQMTSMLDIIEDYLNLMDYKFCRLDGQTSQIQRQHNIDAFNGLISIY